MTYAGFPAAKWKDWNVYVSQQRLSGLPSAHCPQPCPETHTAPRSSVFTQSVAPKPRAKPLHLKSAYSRSSEHVRREPARFTFRFYFWFAVRRQLNERLRSFFKWPAQTSGLFLPCCLYRHFTNIYHYLPQGALSSVIFEITKPLRCGPFKRFLVKLHH